MIPPARRVLSSLAFCVAAAAAALGGLSAAPATALAQGQFDHPKYAAIVVDASSGEVLYALRADQPRYPASITKVMTMYLTFEALATGRLRLDEPVTVSRWAASQIPSKTLLRPGDTLSVDEAIRAVAIHSANDIAVALAERLAGSEARFAQLMTLRAQELGMNQTRFINANGVPTPHGQNVSSARDIAILCRAVMRDYPQYYSYFSQKSMNLRGQEMMNHNRLLLKMPGVDGLKTGFTNAAGFNLAASAVRDGRRLITVVLGGTSTFARDDNVETLLTAGFDVLKKRSLGVQTTIAANIAEPDESGAIIHPAVEQGSGDQSGLRIVMGEPPRLQAVDHPAPMAAVPIRTAMAQPPAPAREPAREKPARRKDPENFVIQVGAYRSREDAKAQLVRLERRFASVVGDTDRIVEAAGRHAFRARFKGFSQAEAKTACRTLSAHGERCMIVGRG